METTQQTTNELFTCTENHTISELVECETCILKYCPICFVIHGGCKICDLDEQIHNIKKQIQYKINKINQVGFMKGVSKCEKRKTIKKFDAEIREFENNLQELLLQKNNLEVYNHVEV